jgi:UDPglucose 6-dehydrogenase
MGFMNLAIVGTGYVGLTTGTVLADRGHRVQCVDIDREKLGKLRQGQVPFFEPGLEPLLRKVLAAKRISFTDSIPDAVQANPIVFMCVPTPPLPSGMADLSVIENVARRIAQSIPDYRLIVEKSTVPVKTGAKIMQVIERYKPRGATFDVASNPEFLREGSAVQDAAKPDRIVIGVDSPKAEKLLRNLYRPFRAPLIVTDVEAAELIKHAANSFLALKISFINAISTICDLVGADVAQVAKAIGMDARIGPAFLNAGVGYGGSCLSKDVQAFQAISKELGYEFDLLRDVEKINREARARFLRKVEEELWILDGKTVAVLGLAFKPNTDDIRDSVAIEIVQELLRKGVKIRAYDPQAMDRARGVLQGAVTFSASAYDACRGADCALVLTEWDEFKSLSLAKMKKLLRHPIVVDGRNVFDPEAMRRQGFVYRAMGRGPAAKERKKR